MKRSMKLFLSVAAFTLGAGRAGAQNTWPLDPMSGDHPFGTSFGELEEYNGLYVLHGGVDILCEPFLSPTSPGTKVVAVADGWVVEDKEVFQNGISLGHRVVVQGTDGFDYYYLHLTMVTVIGPPVDSPPVDFVNKGDELGRVIPWGSPCGFHHLHFVIMAQELDGSFSLLSPLTHSRTAVRIAPNPDPLRPELDAVLFAEDNATPWSSPVKMFDPLSPATGTGTIVRGKVDVVAKGRDKDNAGQAILGTETLWVRKLRWNVAPEGGPAGGWKDAYTFDEMPKEWYSTSTGERSALTYYLRKSVPDYCKETTLYAVATTPQVPVLVSGKKELDPTGCWDTTAGTPNGMYTVTVEAEDFAGNKTVQNARVCVQNLPGTACPLDLTIRDGDGDTGAVPYLGKVAWLSPDIKVNPGTPQEDREVVEGIKNEIKVTFWNFGCVDIPAGKTIHVSLGWGPASPTLPSANLIEKKPWTAPSPNGWRMGGGDEVPFFWTPAVGSIPLGHSCLKAWVEFPEDPLLSATAGVRLDDNQAQRNVEFVPAPPPPSPPRGTPLSPRTPSYGAFFIYPLDEVQARFLEIRLARPEERGRFSRLSVHIGPGVAAGDIRSGQIIGGYLGDEPVSSDKLPSEGPGSRGDSWENAIARGATRVLGFDAGGALRIEGLRVGRQVRVLIEALPSGDVRRGDVTEVHAVEGGIVRGSDETVEIGGLTVKFEH